MIVNILLVVLFFTFFIYYPAKAILSYLKINSFEDYICRLSLTLSLGVTILTIFTIVIQLLKLNLLLLWIFPLVSILYLIYCIYYKNKLSKSYNLNKTWKVSNYLTLIIILVGIITQNLVMFRGGLTTESGKLFPSVHDTMWNISVINELSFQYPPANPAMIDIPLKNHHFFYHILLSDMHQITRISIVDLYFRIGPVLVSLLFGISLYLVSTLFTKNIFVRNLSVYLGIFAGNFAYLAPLFLGSSFDWKGNTFFADQPFDQIINPYSVIGFSMLLVSIYCIYKLTNKDRAIQKNWGLLCAVFIGTLYGFKSFGGLIAIGAFILISVYLLIIKKKTAFLPVFCLTVAIFLFSFFQITDLGKASLNWAPGWLLTQMAGSEKLNIPKLIQIESYYSAIHNYPGLFKIKSLELMIYIIGNLGIRLLGVFYIIWLIVKNIHKDNPRLISLLYIFSIFLISLTIPLLYNLGQNAFNVIQFTPYSLVLSGLFTGLIFDNLSNYYSSKKNKIIIWLFVIVISGLAVPVNIKNIISKIENPNDLIPKDEISAMDYIRNITSLNQRILIDPGQYEFDAIYVPALSQRRIYLASQGYAVQTGNFPTDKFTDLQDFFANPVKSYLTNNKIDYIYLLKKGNSYRNLLKSTNIGQKIIFENKSVIIFSEITK